MTDQMRNPIRVLMAVIVLIQTSCASNASRGPYAPISEGQRDTVKAQNLNQEAAKVIDSDPATAEALLREALTADLYLGRRTTTWAWST